MRKSKGSPAVSESTARLAARLKQKLDRDLGRETEGWVVDLAASHVTLPKPRSKGKGKGMGKDKIPVTVEQGVSMPRTGRSKGHRSGRTIRSSLKKSAQISGPSQKTAVAQGSTRARPHD